MKRDVWLVTGGAGFIGSNLVRHIARETDASVVVLDKLTYAGNRLNLADLLEGEDQNLVFLKGDIAHRPTVDLLFTKYRPTAVLNLAAETHVDRSIDGPRTFLETNVTGTFELLEAAKAYWTGLDPAAQKGFRFLHVSTDEVYGSLGDEGLFDEDSPYLPNSPYAASKASADHLVRAYHETFGLPTLLTNCSNNYGPYQFPEKLIPLVILNAIEGKDLPIYGDGRNVRDWLHVEDHCAGLLLVLREGRIGERFNIGARCPKTNVEVVAEICAALEEASPASRNPALAARSLTGYEQLKKFVMDRPGHDRRYAIDNRKIVERLGFQPKRSFSEGLRETVRWYLDHRDWCEAVQSGRYRRERLGLRAE